MNKDKPIKSKIDPNIMEDMASLLVIGDVSVVAFKSNCGKKANKLLKKCTVIGISIFLYFIYKIQQAIPNIKAPIIANSICNNPKIKDEIIIPI